ncbi:nucleolar protein 12 [Brassica rapa]|nr:nucleolar protein 12 [Brassica rapa]
MGKKKTTQEAKAEESQTQSGIFTTLFSGEAAEAGESSGFSSLFSDNNPFRRKKPDPEPNVDNDEEEEEATVSPAKAKKSKKVKTLASDSDAEGDVEGSGLESKRKKRKRDEIESEYETKKYGTVEETTKKVGEKRKKADEVADTMVSKEGFDDESKLLRTVFVGNLPLKVKKKLILKEFSKFGEVESVRIRSVPIVDSKRTRKGAIMLKQINEKASSVHAYVVFETEQSAEASLALNMSLIDGNHIRVDRACPPRKKLKGEGQDTLLYDSKRTVFIGNLPFDVKDEEVYQLFTGKSNLENNLEAVRVIRDPHLNIGKGIAYVLFKTKEAANLVIKKGYLKLRERELRISRAKPDATPSKRKTNPSEAYSPAEKRQHKDKVVTPTATGKANLSYQGVRASKSGDDDKKKPYQKSPAQSKMRPRSSSSEGNKGADSKSAVKQRSQKRPAVAARKAKANAKGSKESGGKKFAGTKRKQESRTPESFSKKKKTKRV